MKNRYFIAFVFLFLVSFVCFSSVDALDVEPPTLKSVTRYTSNSVSVNYDLSNCTQSNCGILVMNETMFREKAASSIVLRNKNDKQLVWQNLTVGKTYKFRVAVYWFDNNGIMSNSKWSDAVSVVVGSPTSKTATDMVITSGPTKTVYTAGEAFDPSGMKISVIFNDGTNATISNGSGCSFSPSTLTSGTTKVAVTCEGQTAYQTVTVNDAGKTIKSINQVVSNPTKTVYNVGDSFDPSGMKINVTYQDGSSASVDVTSSLCSFSPSTLASGTSKVTVTCGNGSTSVNVTVNVCTPSAPKITKNANSNGIWASSLTASGGTNCGSPYYKWSLDENFTSPVIGTTYSKSTDGVATIYAKACYGTQCSSSTTVNVEIDAAKPDCTVSYYKNANGTTENYTCGYWTQYGVFGRVECTDAGGSGISNVAYKVETSSGSLTDLYSTNYITEGLTSGYTGRSTYSETTYVDRVNAGEADIHYHYGYAIDHAGNEYTSSKCAVKIDRLAPVGGLATAENSTKGKLVWNLTEISDPHSGLGEYRLEYREAGETAWTTVGLNNTTNAFVSKDTTNFTSVPAIEVSRECDPQMAAYEWRVIRTDVAGNSNNSEIFKRTCPSS